MPWVRIDENALEHPKIAALSDGAFRLWVQGLAHCQKYLTDGYIADLALRGLRAYSPKRKAALMEAELWHASETGIRVHDFLEWNDSREHVMAARQLARERLQKHREKRVAPSVSSPSGNGYRNAHTPVTCVDREDLSPERGLGKTGDPLAERAGLFVRETYPTLYAKYRKGARYVSRPALDFQEALELCRVWDDARLEKIATAFLMTDHEFAAKGSRTIAQFRALASWCDSQLVEAGIA